MKKMMTAALCLLLTLCMMMPAAFAEQGKHDKSAAAPAAAFEVDFMLPGADGSTVHLADYAGKVVLINFWGTWCGWCMYEMPAINALAERYADADDVVIITMNYGDTAAEAAAYLQQQGYTHFIVPMDTLGAVTDQFGVEGFPTTLVFDKQCRLAEQVVGVTHDVSELCDYYTGVIEALR